MSLLDIKHEKRNKMIQLQNSLIVAGQIPTCTSCEYWDKPNQKCEKYNMLPPAEVIVTGCVEWVDGIPF